MDPFLVSRGGPMRRQQVQTGESGAVAPEYAILASAIAAAVVAAVSLIGHQTFQLFNRVLESWH